MICQAAYTELKLCQARDREIKRRHRIQVYIYSMTRGPGRGTRLLDLLLLALPIGRDTEIWNENQFLFSFLDQWYS